MSQGRAAVTIPISTLELGRHDLHHGPLTFYDFFAGVGLVELALEPPWKCVWANDIDPKKKAIYDANFENYSRYLLQDVSTVSPDQMPGSVDLAWASFPCQDLSLAGWRRGINGKRSGVFWSFHRLMHQLKIDGRMPRIVVIENVVGLLYGQNFTGLCEALNDLDLNFGALVMDARKFVPQSRPRVFLAALDRNVKTEAVERESETRNPWLTTALRAAVDELPPYLRERWRWWSVPAPTEPIAALAEIIDDEPIGVGWHSDSETNHLINLMSDTNSAKIDSARANGDRSVGFLYRRTRGGEQRAEVRFDGIAGCLRTPNGGSSRQTVVVVDGQTVRTRLLSPREAARLMGVDDEFGLPRNYNDGYKAMGDGVAVPVVRWLSKHLLIQLALAARVNLDGRGVAPRHLEAPSIWDPDLLGLGVGH